ncbi:hypothetical protein PIIN_08215 [Serendipita indica DSM 11827]|uniref:Uncharacterized protein n=1 Tax=Serendipita indica (strain DSM 11827) TaxID=1109443 RepID=G4TSG9_SERID|nr:hypothetical protein PIIN_08215 [Serendipita indica DSM 11827]
MSTQEVSRGKLRSRMKADKCLWSDDIGFHRIQSSP